MEFAGSAGEGTWPTEAGQAKAKTELPEALKKLSQTLGRISKATRQAQITVFRLRKGKAGQ